jgi:hypothetical protein
MKSFRGMHRQMKIRHSIRTLVAAALVATGVGCKKAAQAPPPMPVEQVAPTIETVFQQAPTETRQLATAAAAAVQSSDDVKAFNDLLDLGARTDLTPPQREAVARSMLAVNQRLRQAAERGDKKQHPTPPRRHPSFFANPVSTTKPQQ